MASNAKKVLIIDDDLTELAYICRTLSEICDLYCASSGLVGLETAKEIQPDLIFMDIDMPDRDGFRLLNDLRQDIHTRHIPVCFLSAYSDQNVINSAHTHGANGYITKPATPTSIVREVNNARAA